MHTCVIVDDDIFSIRIIQQLLLNIDDLRCLQYFTDPIEATKYLQEHIPDFLFLDIQMPKMGGFELKDNISKNVEIILTTAHANFALEAYNNNICDYLIKPISQKRFEQAIEKVLSIIKAKKTLQIETHANLTKENAIIIKYKNKNHKLLLSDLLFVESKDEYVCYNTNTDKIIDYNRLKNVERILPEDKFIRIHRSFIVNRSKVKSYNKFSVKLLNNVELPVGKVWREKFVKEFIEASNN